MTGHTVLALIVIGALYAVILLFPPNNHRPPD